VLELPIFNEQSRFKCGIDKVDLSVEGKWVVGGATSVERREQKTKKKIGKKEKKVGNLISGLHSAENL